ncbi:hypothetical protein QBC38DRAFT_45553 [Podospora fimiseda]|uniref:Uncharacterized protein n=1 Tax=Podospora fimiseda TaxID=252190 RepID=A0AAN7GP19_9PEZI|nr:hypothetical protein QBC38DRAFT_45553 [Podospora fimiseda]
MPCDTVRHYSNSTLVRRVPPPDQYGHFPDTAITVGMSWLAVRYPDPLYELITHVLTTVIWQPLKIGETCPVKCDGPALVFLTPACWQSWVHAAVQQKHIFLNNPNVVLYHRESVEGQVKPCEPPKAPCIETITTDIYRPVTRITFIETYRYPSVEEITVAPVVITPIPVVTQNTIIDTDSNGRPTTTVVDVFVSWMDQTVTLSDNKGSPTQTRILTALGPHPTTVGNVVVTIAAESPSYTTVALTVFDEEGSGIYTKTRLEEIWKGKTLAVTLRNPYGVPTATTIYSMETLLKTRTALNFADVSDGGLPTATVTATFTNPQYIRGTKTMTDSHRLATKTITNIGYGGVYMTLTGSDGQPVATIFTDLYFPRQPNGTGGSPPSFHPFSRGDYLLATFAPVLLVVPLGILTQVINLYLKVPIPHYALARKRDGATAADSLCVKTGGIYGYITGFRLLFTNRESMFLVRLMLLLFSAVTVSMSTEAFGIKLYGVCTAQSFSSCHMGIAVYRTPGRLVQIFLSLCLVLVVLLGVSLSRSESKLPACALQTRTISRMASLVSGTNNETRKLFQSIKVNPNNDHISRKWLIKSLEGYSFMIRRRVSQVETRPQSSVLAPSSQVNLVMPSSSTSPPSPQDQAELLDNQKSSDIFPYEFKAIPIQQLQPTTKKTKHENSTCIKIPKVPPGPL